MAEAGDINRGLRPLHLVSGLLIGSFLVAHIANHIAMFWGAAAHIATMDAIRPFYRNVFAETVLMAALVFQLGSGLRLIWRRRKEPKSTLGKIQMASGIALALFIMNHVGAVWAGRLLFGLDTNYHFAAAGFHAGLAVFFIPYYFLGVCAFFAHAACALAWRMENKSAFAYHWGLWRAIGCKLRCSYGQRQRNPL